MNSHLTYVWSKKFSSELREMFGLEQGKKWGIGTPKT